jgi:hypothetical protein
MYRHSNKHPNSDLRALVLCRERALGPATVIPWAKKSSSIEVQDLWTAFLDARSGGSCSTLSGSFNYPCPCHVHYLSPCLHSPRPSGRPDRFGVGHSCPALRNMNHGYLEGIRKKDMAYMATRWYACSAPLPVEDQFFYGRGMA